MELPILGSTFESLLISFFLEFQVIFLKISINIKPLADSYIGGLSPSFLETQMLCTLQKMLQSSYCRRGLNSRDESEIFLHGNGILSQECCLLVVVCWLLVVGCCCCWLLLVVVGCCCCCCRSCLLLLLLLLLFAVCGWLRLAHLRKFYYPFRPEIQAPWHEFFCKKISPF